jgi:putative Holliday junction resolvase
MSDPLGILASPLTRIERTDDEAAVKGIADLVGKHEAKAVVAGLPYSMDGNVGQQAVRVQDFLRKLSEFLHIPILTWDERLSTVAVQREMIESGMRKGDRREKVDAAAAALILQGYLDRLRREQAESDDQGSSMTGG